MIQALDQVDDIQRIQYESVSYTPDLNPAEEMFSKIKKFLVNYDIAFSITMAQSFIITMPFNTITTADCHHTR